MNDYNRELFREVSEIISNIEQLCLKHDERCSLRKGWSPKHEEVKKAIAILLAFENRKKLRAWFEMQKNREINSAANDFREWVEEETGECLH